MGDGTSGIDWRTHAKIGLYFAVAIGVLVAFVVFGRDIAKDNGGDNLAMTIWSASMLLGGFVAFRSGWKGYREQQLIRNTPTSKVQSLAVGNVELHGTVRPLDRTLVSPVTEQDVALWQLEIEEKRKERNDNYRWATVFQVQDHVRFLLDDGTGQVRVDPTEADLDLQQEDTMDLEAGQPPPARLVQWAKAQGWSSGSAESGDEVTTGLGGDLHEKLVDRAEEQLTGPVDADRRFTEKVLPMATEAYVFGGARPREGEASTVNPENLEVGVHQNTGKLLISNQSEAAFAEAKLDSTGFKLAASLALIPIGAWGLMFAWDLFG